MAYNRNGCLGSLGSLTSLASASASRSSIENYESIKEEISNIERSQTDLQSLVDGANNIIDEKFALDPRSTYVYNRGSKKISVKLDKVMSSMLECAEECGGDSAKRYVASAIVACDKQEDVIGTLAALGTTWLTHFLFVFKISRGHETQPDQDPHELATPSLEEAASHGWGWIDDRPLNSYESDLIQRDGFKCVLTGFQDTLHPKRDTNIPAINLEAIHIFRWAIGKFDKPDDKSDSFKSAVTTFDILVNYTRLPVKTLEESKNYIDDVSNGMMLEWNACLAFDNFYWCLKKTETENVYAIKMFENIGLLWKPKDNIVTFRNHSDEFSSSGTSCKRNHTNPLPNPHYIAIHAAMAEILNVSGAGRFFDELLGLYKDDEADEVSALRSWGELEKLMREDILRESVAALLHPC